MSCQGKRMSIPSRRSSTRKGLLRKLRLRKNKPAGLYTGVMLRVPYDDLYAALLRAMQGLGLAPDRATECARLFAETTRDGVYTHGLNRFPRFVASIANGSVDVNAVPTKAAGMGALERWDGRRGVGNLNASASMQRAIDLAKQYGI